MKSLLFLLLVSSGVCAKNFALSVETSLEGEREQQAVTMSGKSLIFSRNSNFLCPEAHVVVLGKFEFPLSPPYTDGIKLLRLQSRNISSEVKMGEKESIRFFAGDKQVVGDNPFYQVVKSNLNQACDEFGLKNTQIKNQNIVVVARVEDRLEIYNPQKDKTTKLPLSKACRNIDGNLRCKVPGWGIANFKIENNV